MSRPFALCVVLALVAACMAPNAHSASGPPSTSPSPLPNARPSREPGDLAQLPQEETVLRAFRAAGILVQTVGQSRFADTLGPIRRARVFIVDAGSRGADILFLEALPPTLQVCATPSPPGYVRYTILVNGQRASSEDSPEGRPVYYLVSSQFFVIAWDEATSAALQRGLGVAPAGC